MNNKNMLLGYGETLTSPVILNTGGGPKISRIHMKKTNLLL